MANCQSSPLKQPSSPKIQRTSSLDTRSSLKKQQHIYYSSDKNKRSVLGDYSAADLLLYHLHSQANYRLSDHDFHPHIVAYFNARKANTKSRKVDAGIKEQSQRQQQSSINQNQRQNQYPFNCVGAIFAQDQQNPEKIQRVGSGCLVAPNLVLTSALALSQSPCNNPEKHIKFCSSLSENIKETWNNGVQIIDYRLGNGQTGNTNEGDYALVLLKSPVMRERYGYIGYDISKQTETHLLTYRDYKPVLKKGAIVHLEKEYFTHSHRAKDQSLGAPIMVRLAEGFLFIIGLNSKYSKNKHYACRMTTSKVESLKSWAKELTKGKHHLTIIQIKSLQLQGTSKQQNAKDNSFTLIQQIAQIQQLVDFERQSGETDQLRFYLGKLGELCWKNGQFNRSILNLEEGLRICNLIYKAESIESAFFYSNLGLNYDKLKMYEQAYKNFELSLRINRKKKGENSLGVAIAYNNIGNIFKRKGRYEKALEYYNKSLKIKMKVSGQKSEGVAASLSNIALLQWQKKHYDQAVKKYKQSLSIYRTILGPLHPEISRTLYNLALCYYDMKEMNEWLQQHYNSLKILEKLKMTGHPSYLKRMNVLLQNVNSLAGKDNIGSEIVLKAIKILDRVGAGVKDEDIKERLHNKLESFK